jgi:AcrR family transcriptional regulator
MEYNEKQLHIMDSAEKLFSEKGFNGTSVRDIAEDADVNLAMISYYFGSKEKLLEAVFDFRGQTLRNQLEAMLHNKILTPLEKFYELIDFYIDRLKKHQCFHRIMAREQVVHTSGLVSDLILKMKRTNLDLVKQLVQEGQRKKHFKKNIDVILLMSSLIGTINHVLTTKHYYKELTDQQSMSDEQFEEYLKKKVGAYLKSLYKAILTHEE